MTRRLDPVLGNAQRLDGGAMFGNAPRTLWATWAPPDDRHRIELACRALLVTDTAPEGRVRRVLLETGIGAFFAPELRDRFGVLESRHVLLDSLATLGLSHEDIDVVVLSHLHFDHAGGLLEAHSTLPDGSVAPARLLFPRARFLVGREAWNRALHPHRRDKASFISELPALLEASGRLEIVDSDHSATLGEGFRFHRSDGHTPGLLLTEVAMPEGPVLFAADLIPGLPWVRAAITMGYDRFPELLIDEKTRLLEDLVDRNGSLFFTHDPQVATARLRRDAKGHVVAGDTA